MKWTLLLSLAAAAGGFLCMTAFSGYNWDERYFNLGLDVAILSLVSLVVHGLLYLGGAAK